MEGRELNYGTPSAKYTSTAITGGVFVKAQE